MSNPKGRIFFYPFAENMRACAPFSAFIFKLVYLLGLLLWQLLLQLGRPGVVAPGPSGMTSHLPGAGLKGSLDPISCGAPRTLTLIFRRHCTLPGPVEIRLRQIFRWQTRQGPGGGLKNLA